MHRSAATSFRNNIMFLHDVKKERMIAFFIWYARVEHSCFASCVLVERLFYKHHNAKKSNHKTINIYYKFAIIKKYETK